MKKILFPLILTAVCALGLFVSHITYWIRLGDGDIAIKETRIYLTPKESKDLLGGGAVMVYDGNYKMSEKLHKEIVSKKLKYDITRNYYLSTQIQCTKVRENFPFTGVIIDTLQSTSLSSESCH